MSSPRRRARDSDAVAVSLARLEGRAAALGIRPRDLTVDDVSEIAGDVARRLGHEPAETVQAVLRRLMPHEL